MQITTQHANVTARYAKCVEVSKRIRWDIDRDVIRGRKFDYARKFLPDGLSMVDRMEFLTAAEKRFMSQIQGRTYANIFGLVERFIVAKVLEVSRSHWLGDQTALEALVRFCDEELKHQELFRRLELLTAEGMPDGYQFLPDPDAVARAVLGKSTWAVLGLTCHIELFTQAHYRQSIETDTDLSELWKDVFLFHWKEESQHAILDELEWVHENAKLTPEARDRRSTDLIALVGAVDGVAPGAGSGGRRLLRQGMWPITRQGGDRTANKRAGGLPLAVHRVRSKGPAFQRNPRRNDHRTAGSSHS